MPGFAQLTRVATYCLRQVVISNDGATIMKTLEIVHPAAKSMVDISMAQDSEVLMHDMSLPAAFGLR